jgi:hypothetical protein
MNIGALLLLLLLAPPLIFAFGALYFWMCVAIADVFFGVDLVAKLQMFHVEREIKKERLNKKDGLVPIKGGKTNE